MEKVKTNYGYKIGKLAVDMTSYNGKDTYSDGGIEDEILAAVREGKEKELLYSDNRWPIVYHLSDMRENLLSWLNIGKDKRVLEIGGGCGALTGILAEQSKTVDMVEISPRRAEIAAYRNKQHDNITIHVGNLNDMDFKEKFDYVTLIGVLEYAGSFTHTANPYSDFVEKCASLLKPDGVLVVAIENRLGMKYFSGALEDHTGRRFDGITDYENYSGIRTFARKELGELLLDNGFNGLEWYYPYPDYKLPSDIFSDKALPTANEISQLENFTCDNDRIELFSEINALASVCDAGLFGELNNSFLVLAHVNKDFTPHTVEKVHVSLMRNDSHRMATATVRIDGKKYIKKTALTKAAEQHIKTIVENYKILAARYGADRVAKSKLIDNGKALIMEYVEGKTFWELMLQAVKEEGIKGLLGYLEYYYNNIVDGEGSGFCFNGFNDVNRKYDTDLNFSNIIVDNNGNITYIDYEWLAPQISKELVLYNSIFLFFVSNHEFLAKYDITFERLTEILGINERLVDDYERVKYEKISNLLNCYLKNYYKKRLPISLGLDV